MAPEAAGAGGKGLQRRRFAFVAGLALALFALGAALFLRVAASPRKEIPFEGSLPRMNGIALGMAVEEVERIRARPENRAASVRFQDGRVQSVEGDRLEQDGRILLRTGDPAARVCAWFGQELPQRIYDLGPARLELDYAEGRINAMAITTTEIVGP